MDTNNSVMMAGGEGGRYWVEVGEGRINGDICNGVNNKCKI